MHKLAYLLPLCLVACATESAVGRAADDTSLSVDQANKIVDSYAKRRALKTEDPLAQPKSLDDVLEILRRDQIDLFPGGVKFATADGSPKATALKGQILLAWGEGQLILSDLLERSVRDLRAAKRTLELKKNPSDKDQARLAELSTTLSQIEGISQALGRAADRHLKDGIDVATELVANQPNDYHGYRLAADYYRLTSNWPAFDTAMKKIESLNPKSNGLVFLQGLAELHDNNRLRAVEYFREALKRDPKFARAEVELMLVQNDPETAFDELEKLRQINPNHQIVTWAGGAIKAARDHQVDLRERRREALPEKMVPGREPGTR